MAYWRNLTCVESGNGWQILRKSNWVRVDLIGATADITAAREAMTENVWGHETHAINAE